ncbi:hypothetical protein LIER_26212 [Lithospermum erythrorhizon]|uniref:Photosystem I reaction center subunit III n=1 Tax=Lithospermum erythrorhizon TaxID=34254 RepID=A0AAV3R7K2_LITER
MDKGKSAFDLAKKKKGHKKTSSLPIGSESSTSTTSTDGENQGEGATILENSLPVANPQQVSDEAASSSSSALKGFSAVLALSSILLSKPVLPASADITGLMPCKESKQFAKCEEQELKKLESSLKLYAPDSTPALAIKATMDCSFSTSYSSSFFP